MAAGGITPFQPVGTDKVPAMLTPGEFVVSAKNAKDNMGLLHQINQGGNLFSRRWTNPYPLKRAFGNKLSTSEDLQKRQEQIVSELFPKPITMAKDDFLPVPKKKKKSLADLEDEFTIPMPEAPPPKPIPVTMPAPNTKEAANLIWRKADAGGNIEEELRMGMQYATAKNLFGLTPPETGILTGLKDPDKSIYDNIASLKNIEARRETAEQQLGTLKLAALTARGHGFNEEDTKAKVDYMDALRGMAVVRRAILADSEPYALSLETKHGTKARAKDLGDKVSTTDLQSNIDNAMKEMPKPQHQAAIAQLIAQKLGESTSTIDLKKHIEAMVIPTRGILQTAMTDLTAGTGSYLNVTKKADNHAQVLSALKKVQEPGFRADKQIGQPLSLSGNVYGPNLDDNIDQAISSLTNEAKNKYDKDTEIIVKDKLPLLADQNAIGR